MGLSNPIQAHPVTYSSLCSTALTALWGVPCKLMHLQQCDKWPQSAHSAGAGWSMPPPPWLLEDFWRKSRWLDQKSSHLDFWRKLHMPACLKSRLILIWRALTSAASQPSLKFYLWAAERSRGKQILNGVCFDFATSVTVYWYHSDKLEQSLMHYSLKDARFG